ncbi:serine protease inhibitor Kazal-type 1-like [Gracilinanus agilis]|uniref:serine protease inhibitor Kazal-type 1-like n=1 Tax=Gracilinanus agilis TaxID=191870 RepID=UPI001CFD6EA2|nr:serine protease inhibitor Kazal-type 1-like [Gracilinanus agilis]
MRPLSIFLLLSIALCCFLDTVQAKDQTREAKCNPNFPGCPRDLAPVCGTDGHTYGNECVLCMENKKRHVAVRIQKDGPC